MSSPKGANMLYVPKQVISALAAAISSSVPPAITVSVPFAAFFTPPDTGASIRRIPFEANVALRRIVSSGGLMTYQ